VSARPRRFRAGRGAALAGLLAVAAGLCAYGRWSKPWLSYAECLENPARCEGRVVGLFREPVIGELRAGGFMLRQRDLPPVFVAADTAGLRPGEFVALAAVFRDGGARLEAVEIRIAWLRREKMAVSLLPVPLVAFLFLRAFRWKGGAFRPREGAGA
jgi:hypothetical protein